MRSIVYVSLICSMMVRCYSGAFRSSLLFRLLDVVPSQVRFVVDRLLCFLIVGIQASGISIPLSLLMLLGWSLIWIASLTLRVYQWGSRSINLTSFQIGRCPVSLACSETAEVCVRASRISLSCSFILSCIALPVSPIYTIHRLYIYTTAAKHLTSKPSAISKEKKHLSSVLVSNGYPSSFVRKLTKTTRPTTDKEPTQEFKSTAVLPYMNEWKPLFNHDLF